MEREELLARVPYIYHLTDSRNLDFIREEGRLYSMSQLTNMSTVEDKAGLNATRRPDHVILHINGHEIFVRDQRPLNAALDKCLTDHWTREQYIELLNSRVFFWPNIGRLNTHFGRYVNEEPIIFRVSLEAALDINNNVELCHLNSGATRPLATLGGLAPERGPNTFRPIDQYDKGIIKLAEVTFVNSFLLPDNFEIATHPDGIWETLEE